MSKSKGFTLIELLVVISIIALLIGILLPALKQGKDCGSGSRVSKQRPWMGAAEQAYLTDNRLQYPWDGPDIFASTVATNNDGVSNIGSGTAQSYQNAFNQDVWWPNAVGSYVMGGTTYAEMAITLGSKLPIPGVKSPFVCPSAMKPNPASTALAAPFMSSNTHTYYNPATGTISTINVGFYSNYQVNSKLNRGSGGSSNGQPGISIADLNPNPHGTTLSGNASDLKGQNFAKGEIPGHASDVVIFTEGRASKSELPATESAANPNPTYGTYADEAVNRCKGSWNNFAYRHDGGGNLTMGDGSARRFSYMEATRGIIPATGAVTYGSTAGIKAANLDGSSNTSVDFNHIGSIVWSPWAVNSN